MRPIKIPNLKAQSSKLKAPDGFTLLETLVAIGLVSVLLSVYTSVLFSSVFLRRSYYNIQATLFIQEELDSLRMLPYSELLNRTDGNFLGVAMTRGPWRVKTAIAPPSGTQVLAMETEQPALIEETGLAVLPGNYREAGTFTAKVKALSTSPAGWGAGIALRYRDAENHYRFRFTSGGIAFDKVYQGVKTTLWSQSTAHAADTWYTLEVIATGPVFILKRNGSLLGTVNDGAFSRGDLALFTLNDGRAHFDDVTSDEIVFTNSWNFDADTEGELPVEWQRMSALDLPGGTGTLTLANYLGQPAIKQATVTIGWIDADQSRSMTGSTLIAQ